MNFTPTEQKILAIIQKNIPDSLTPFADIAAVAGVSELEVLQLIKNLQENGTIRRFGASLRHQNAGWESNLMVAWSIENHQLEQCGRIAAANAGISHAYFRPSVIPDWPYEFYTMIHGKSDAECKKVIDELLKNWPLKQYIVLKTIRELKKVSPTYFHD